MLSFRSFNHFTIISLALLGLTVSSVNAATLFENPFRLSGDGVIAHLVLPVQRPTGLMLQSFRWAPRVPSMRCALQR